MEQSWRDMLKEFEVRECKVCTSLIASDGRYGRKASASDAEVCEVCEVMTPEQAARLRAL